MIKIDFENIKDIKTTCVYMYINTINNKTEGTREWQFVYQIREDVLDINWEVEPEYDDDGEMIPGTGEGAEIAGCCDCLCRRRLQCYWQLLSLY